MSKTLVQAMTSNVLDFMSQERITLWDKVISLCQCVPEFRKNLRSELKVIIAHYPIVKMI